MKLIQVKDYEEMSQKACHFILEKIKKIEHPVLGLATGSTPEGLYQYLINAYREKRVSFQRVTTFNLDEYVNLDRKNPNSYYFYMQEKLFTHIDIPKENTYFPNGNAIDLEKECLEYEKKIARAGKIDLQVLGLGLNGHIGFNEPGTPFSSRTHLVELAESTRIANSIFFHHLDDVPKRAITMGIGTIMESKEILLLVSGENKAFPLDRFINGEINEQFPASILKTRENVTIIADSAALRIK